MANPDDELRQRVRNFLNARGVPGRESLDVEVASGTVTVAGRLPSPHDQWLCVECCRHVAGVIRVIEKLESVSGSQLHMAQSPPGGDTAQTRLDRFETRYADGMETAPRHKRRKR